MLELTSIIPQIVGTDADSDCNDLAARDLCRLGSFYKAAERCFLLYNTLEELIRIFRIK